SAGMAALAARAAAQFVARRRAAGEVEIQSGAQVVEEKDATADGRAAGAAGAAGTDADAAIAAFASRTDVAAELAVADGGVAVDQEGAGPLGPRQDAVERDAGGSAGAPAAERASARALGEFVVGHIASGEQVRNRRGGGRAGGNAAAGGLTGI